MPKESKNAEEADEVEDAEDEGVEKSKAPTEEAEPIEEVEEAEIAETVTEEETTEELEEEVEETEEAEEAEVEEKVEKPEKKEVEEEIVEERLYTIPLSRAWISPRRKRAPRAIRLIESFVERHMKLRGEGLEEEDAEARRLVISNEVNERVWSRGIEKPPRKIRVRVTEDKEGKVTVYLAEGD